MTNPNANKTTNNGYGRGTDKDMNMETNMNTTNNNNQMIEVFYKVQQRLLEDFTKKWNQPDYHLWLQKGPTNENRSNRHDDAKASDQVHSRSNARDDTERGTAKGRRDASQKYSDVCAGRNQASNIAIEAGESESAKRTSLGKFKRLAKEYGLDSNNEITFKLTPEKIQNEILRDWNPTGNSRNNFIVNRKRFQSFVRSRTQSQTGAKATEATIPSSIHNTDRLKIRGDKRGRKEHNEDEVTARGAPTHSTVEKEKSNREGVRREEQRSKNKDKEENRKEPIQKLCKFFKTGCHHGNKCRFKHPEMNIITTENEREKNSKQDKLLEDNRRILVEVEIIKEEMQRIQLETEMQKGEIKQVIREEIKKWQSEQNKISDDNRRILSEIKVMKEEMKKGRSEADVLKKEVEHLKRTVKALEEAKEIEEEETIPVLNTSTVHSISPNVNDIGAEKGKVDIELQAEVFTETPLTMQMSPKTYEITQDNNELEDQNGDDEYKEISTQDVQDYLENKAGRRITTATEISQTETTAESTTDSSHPKKAQLETEITPAQQEEQQPSEQLENNLTPVQSATETPNDDFTINNTLRDVPPRIMEMHRACKGSRKEESEEESETDADNNKYISDDSGDNSEENLTTAIRTPLTDEEIELRKRKCHIKTCKKTWRNYDIPAKCSDSNCQVVTHRNPECSKMSTAHMAAKIPWFCSKHKLQEKESTCVYLNCNNTASTKSNLICEDHLEQAIRSKCYNKECGKSFYRNRPPLLCIKCNNTIHLKCCSCTEVEKAPAKRLELATNYICEECNLSSDNTEELESANNASSKSTDKAFSKSS